MGLGHSSHINNLTTSGRKKKSLLMTQFERKLKACFKQSKSWETENDPICSTSPDSTPSCSSGDPPFCTSPIRAGLSHSFGGGFLHPYLWGQALPPPGRDWGKEGPLLLGTWLAAAWIYRLDPSEVAFSWGVEIKQLPWSLPKRPASLLLFTARGEMASSAKLVFRQ